MYDYKIPYIVLLIHNKSHVTHDLNHTHDLNLRKSYQDYRTECAINKTLEDPKLAYRRP